MASPEAVRLLESVYSRVDAQVRAILATMPGVSIAAQDDDQVIANSHRILNFQGPGVVVSDDPAMRRANVFIPGAPTASATTTVVSSTAAKALSLWNGSSNNTPPSGWEQPLFNDSAWSAAVVATVGVTSSYQISGTSMIWATAGPASNTEQALIRQSFTLPAGTITDATLQFGADDANDGVWINGVAVTPSAAVIWTSPDPLNNLTAVSRPANSPVIPANVMSLLTPGATNWIAVRGRNMFATGKLVTYRIDVTIGSAGTDTQYQLLAEKNVANGYAGLDAGARVPTARLGSGTADATTFLRGDQTYAAASTNAVTVDEVDAAPSVTATRITFPNGSLTDNGGGHVTYTPPSLGTVPYINIADQKVSGTQGGTFTTGAWQTRTLNTVLNDSSSVASLSTNQVSLPAGKYQFRAIAPAYDVGRHQVRLQNITDAITVALGIPCYEAASNVAQTVSIASGEFTIAATKAFEVQHRCEFTRATNGQGLATSWGTEVFTVVEFWKIS